MMLQKQKNNFFLKLKYLARYGKAENLMEEKKIATIRNENDERQDVEILVDDVELTPEMEAELSNGNGGEE